MNTKATDAMISSPETWPQPLDTGPARGTRGLAARWQARTGVLSWEHAALAGILLLAAFLNIWRLDQQGLGNPYYATAVFSMLQSWHNTFFLSYDPSGFVSVDKPPLGFWVQTLSARLFGFSGWSLLLPQAIAGVLSVAVLHHLVRRVFGPLAGLLAALALAVTPIAVAVNRNNTIDALLVLTLLLAAWAITLAAERGSLRWLLLAATLIGLGFNIKMLQAYLVVPAFFFVYLVGGGRLSLPKRIVHLAAATAVLLAVSLSWAVAVDRTPAEQRPYVGSSEDNSVVSLIVGYNGLARLLGGSAFGLLDPGGGANGGPPGGMTTPLAFETGPAGVLRLFNDKLGGQIAWLIPLAAVGLVAAWWQQPARRPLGRRHQALLLWGGWFLTAAAFFSVAGMWHRYYLVMLSPPIAALAGAGLAAMWADYRRPGGRGWLLPAALLGTAAAQAAMLAAVPEWSARLTPWIALLAVAAATALGAVRMLTPPEAEDPRLSRIAAAAVAAGITATLIGPLTWSAITAAERGNTVLPAAGPGSFMTPFGPVDGAGGAAGAAGPPGLTMFGVSDPDPALIAYLQEQRGDAAYLLATASTWDANAIILATGEPVAALGGFAGRDPILSLAALQDRIAAGEMRFFLAREMRPPDAAAQPDTLPGSQSGPMTGGGATNSLFGDSENVTWIKERCTAVPESAWRSQDAAATYAELDGTTLFDCAEAVDAASGA